jgi:peptide/nickel transport system substrate-binding protein
MRKRSILLLAGVVALLGTLVIGPAATAGPERTSAGTVVLIHDQEPPNLQNNWVGNGTLATAYILNNIWYGGQIRDGNAGWALRNFASKPKLVKSNPHTVQITFAKNAQWSDGKPMTGADFKATWQVNINPNFNVNDRTGWSSIKSVVAKGKTATIVFKNPYADWENLVSTGLYQAAAVTGKDMNQTFLNSIPISSGPWKFDSWQKGVQIAVVRNPRFKVGAPMKLDRVVWKYILDTNARFQAIKANEGQATESQAQLQVADFLNNKSYTVHAGAGYSFEHIDIQFGPKGHPALKQRFVRQALISGINRAQIAGTLYKTIYPGLKPLQSTVFFPVDKQYYKPNYQKWSFNQQNVINLLKKGGCTGGPDKPSASNGDIFSCPGTGKLSFRFFTTTGNQLRALTFEIMQKQLKSVGIEIVPRFQTSGVLFGTTRPSRDWDLMMFGFSSSPSWSISALTPEYGCGGDDNEMAYCNRKVTAIFSKIEKTLDANERAKLANMAESKYMVNDVATIPLFAKPFYLIGTTKLKGLVWNPTQEGYPWNVNGWSYTS